MNTLTFFVLPLNNASPIQEGLVFPNKPSLPELTRTTLPEYWPGKNKLSEVLSRLRDEFWVRADNPTMSESDL